MIDTDKYEGLTLYDLDNMTRRELVLMLEAFNKSLTEVKQLRKALEIEQQIVQAFYEYREDCCFDHCEAWMLEKGHRVMVNTGDNEQSEWKVEIE